MVLNKIDNEEKIIGKKLYDYQHGAIDKIFQRIKDNPTEYNLLYQLPTGGGKTVIFSEIARQYINSNHHKVLILTHRIELSKQTSNMLTEFGVKNKIIDSSVKEVTNEGRYSCFVAMVETLNNRIKENKAEHDRVIGPRNQALESELSGLKSQGCFMGAKDNDLYKQCHGPEVSWRGRKDALKSDARAYVTKHDQLVAQKKQVSQPYDERLKKVRAEYQSFLQRWNGYNEARKSWDADLKQVWGESTQLFMQAQKPRKQAPAKPKGGELGKLSGPMEKGSSERSPGSAKLPAGAKVAGEGGAMGQARAAKSTGEQGVGAESDSEAAFQAGRVFDRGDVQASGDAGVVDARGVEPRQVPEAVRQNPRWQALDRKEQAYRAEQKQAQQEIDAIKQKLQAGEGNKGELQVELVKARDKKDRIESKVNVIKVEKESFQLSIEEKPAAPKKSGGGK